MTWLPFDLHPEYPPEGIPLAELHRRYGIGHGDADPLRERFEVAGLVYNRPEIVPNTRLALRLTELARDLGLHAPTHDRLMDAYWAEGQNIGEPDVLRALTAEVALPPDEVERVLAGDDYAARVQASTEQAAALGINGIPAFLIDERLLVLGAQPREVFERAFESLAA